MELIKQKSSYDCGAACLAMVMGLESVEKAYEILGYNPADVGGTYDQELMAALHGSGRLYYYEQAFEHADNFEDRPLLRRRGDLQMALCNHQLGAAIVAVPTRNLKWATFPHTHFVVARQGKVYDPAIETMYACPAKDLPVQAVIWVMP